jgi:hypothetical protein
MSDGIIASQIHITPRLEDSDLTIQDPDALFA